MKKALVVVALSAFCGSAAVTGLALTSVKAAKAQPEIAPNHPLAETYARAMDQEAGMAAWMKASTPGPAHAWLGQMLGTWKTVATMHMGDQEMTSQGTAEYTWLMEGRFIQDNFRGEMMGMPMHGYGITGFDNLKNQYVGVWLDNFGTGMMPMQGSLDPTGKILTMVGHMDEPMTGEMGKAIMAVTTLIDRDHFRFEMKEILYGEAFTVLTIEYTRAR